jgi:hypothetical protein
MTLRPCLEQFLRSTITGSPPSSELFARCLEMPKTELLALIGATNDAPSELVDDSKVQRFIWESLIVLGAALVLNKDEERVRLWFRREKISDFGHKTPAVLVAEGKADALLKYIESISFGSSG